VRPTTTVLILAAALAAGCDAAPPKVAAPPPPAAAPGAAREDAALLASRGDWVAAEKKYREALQAEPDDVQLHFGLASVLTQLDRRDEAAEEFRWVVKNGRLGQPEVDTARRWLADSGQRSPGATTAAEPVDKATLGAVAGKLTWPNIPADMTFGIRIVVTRNDDANVRKSAKTKLNGSFTVPDLPEGAYTLTGLAGPTRIWSDLPVTVSAGRQTTIDLTPANAVVSATEFPARMR
jgi:hypothetical protein